MRKSLGALVAVLAMALTTLVVGAGAPAQAACAYPLCVLTKSHVGGPELVGAKARSIKVRTTVRPLQGNAKPPGVIKVAVRRLGGGYNETSNADYTGPRQPFTFGKLKPGKYRVLMWYKPYLGVIFRPSRDIYSLRVK